jgi:F-type H+-transporting ATPase subunit b
MKQCGSIEGKGLIVVGASVVFLLVVVVSAVAGEGHEAAGHHQSLYAALAENPIPLLKDLLWRLVNFAVLLWILIKFTGKPIKNYFANRREALVQGINEAREAKKAAERLYLEYQEKLASLEDEVKELESRIRAEAEAEKQRIVNEAEQFAVKVRQQAEQMANQEVIMAKRRLKDEASKLSLQAAEKMIKENISAVDQDKMVENYLEKVVGAQ